MRVRAAKSPPQRIQVRTGYLPMVSPIRNRQTASERRRVIVADPHIGTPYGHSERPTPCAKGRYRAMAHRNHRHSAHTATSRAAVWRRGGAGNVPKTGTLPAIMGKNEGNVPKTGTLPAVITGAKPRQVQLHRNSSPNSQGMGLPAWRQAELCLSSHRKPQ